MSLAMIMYGEHVMKLAVNDVMNAKTQGKVPLYQAHIHTREFWEWQLYLNVEVNPPKHWFITKRAHRSDFAQEQATYSSLGPGWESMNIANCHLVSCSVSDIFPGGNSSRIPDPSTMPRTAHCLRPWPPPSTPWTMEIHGALVIHCHSGPRGESNQPLPKAVMASCCHQSTGEHPPGGRPDLTLTGKQPPFPAWKRSSESPWKFLQGTPSPLSAWNGALFSALNTSIHPPRSRGTS